MLKPALIGLVVELLALRLDYLRKEHGQYIGHELPGAGLALLAGAHLLGYLIGKNQQPIDST
jgi:hypothetical protein